MVFNILSHIMVLLGKVIINSNNLNYGKGKRLCELGFTLNSSNLNYGKGKGFGT